LTKVRDIWAESNAVAGLMERTWIENKTLTHSKHITTRKFGQSNLFVPMIEKFHYRKQADHFFAFTGDNPVSLKQTLTSTREGAAIMERVVNYYIKEAGGIDWDTSVLNCAHNALTYNFAPWFVDWDRDVEEIEVDVDVLDEEGNIANDRVKDERELYSYPTLEIISPDDMRIDPSIGWDEVGLARYGIIRRWRDKAFAEKMERSGQWPEVDERYFTSRKDLGSQLKQTTNNINIGLSNAADGFIEVWYSYYYNDEGIPVRAVTIESLEILEDEKELEFDTSDKDGSDPWPFGVGIVYAEPHQLYSRAMPEKLKNLQIEKNAIRNQRRDNVALVLNREKFMTKNAGIDPATLSRSIPGKVNIVSNKNDVWWDAPPDVTASSYNEETVTTTDAEQLVSESAQRSGGSSQRKETATVAKITAANANTAVSLDTGVFGMTFAKRAVKKIIRMIRLAAPPELFEAAAEDAMVDVADPYSEALLGTFKITVGNGVQQSARDMEISQASNTAAIIQSVYGPQANYYPILAPMLEAMGLNPSEIIQDPAAQQQNQQVQQDAGGVGGQSQIPPQQVSAVQGGQFGTADQPNQNT
jgi:hypothetical protein